MDSRQGIKYPIVLGGSALVAIAAILVSCTGSGSKPDVAAANPACPAPAAIPAGFGYPQSAATIQQWVSSRNIPAARGHGWGLFAGLMSDSGGKWVWRTWCTETQAFANTGAEAQGDASAAPAQKEPSHGDRPMRMFKLANGQTTGSEPINFKVAPVYTIPAPVAEKYASSGCILPPSKTSPIPTLANGAQFQNNGDVMIAGVIYNQPAYDWIRQKKLYEAATLQGLRPAANQTAQMQPMPAGSISLKPMLWPVKKQGYTALPVWDDLKTDNGVYSGFEVQSQWPRAVAVTPQSASQIATVDVSYLDQPGVTMGQGGPRIGPNKYRQARTVGIEQFYNFQPDLSKMEKCDRALLDASAYYAYGRMFEQGDYLALVAMHIITKEQPDWTFQSVWWSDRPALGEYAADRPNIPGAKGPWQHYLMTSTYGWTQAGNSKLWPVAYNPYIELAADHPIKTNCANCHLRAAWPNDGTGYLAPNGPGALDVFSYDGLPIFNGLIGVDRLWSISDRVAPPSAGPVGSEAKEPAAQK